MIKITKSGAQFTFSQEEKIELQNTFHSDNFVRLPQILDDEILQEFLGLMREEDWVERIHDGIGVEVCLNDRGLSGLMNFLFNDQALFQLLEEISGCEHIGSFDGRFYRMLPNSGHYDSWHTDVTGHRLIALSVNLSPAIYKGGTLQIRQHRNEQSAVEVPNTGFGDAVLFRIHPGLEHQVTAVEGAVPKTAFAGWFKNQPDFWAALTRGLSAS